MIQVTRPLVLLALLLASFIARAAEPMVSSYVLDVEFEPGRSSMQGQATIRFTGPLQSGATHFYLHGELKVESVTLNGKPIEFHAQPVLYDADYSLVANKVSFELDNAVPDATLTVSYGGYFHPSATRSPSDYMRIDDDGVFLRAWGYSPWFPVFLEDDGEVYRVDLPSARFKIPRRFELVFVGEKTAEQLTPQHAISTWRVDDVKLWDLQVTAREFRWLKSGSVTIYHLDDEASRQAARAVADFTQQLLAYYQTHYRQDAGMRSLNLLEMPEYGDISSHNMVGVSTQTFRSFDTAIYAKRTIAHELVHPFVSVRTSRADPLWSLAIEGLPSFFHLPALRQVYGSDFYDEFMQKVEASYLDNKGVEKDRWGNTRPPEVPLMEIAAANMSEYKDDYILWGRSKLFFNYLLRQMGESQFDAFSKELFSRTDLTETDFVGLCETYLPGKKAQIHTWLYSNDFPQEFRIQ